jgi:hypothetical protein
VPRSTLKLDAGRYAVLEGAGSVAALYRAWRRGFDRWLAISGECPKPGRLYLRFPQSLDPTSAPSVALYIPLEDPPAAVLRYRPRARGMQTYGNAGAGVPAR